MRPYSTLKLGDRRSNQAIIEAVVPWSGRGLRLGRGECQLVPVARRGSKVETVKVIARHVQGQQLALYETDRKLPLRDPKAFPWPYSQILGFDLRCVDQQGTGWVWDADSDDVEWGNEYTGPLAECTRVFGRFSRADGEQVLEATVYVYRYAGSAVSRLRIKLSNCSSTVTGEGACGVVYFDHITLTPVEGMVCVPDILRRSMRIDGHELHLVASDPIGNAFPAGANMDFDLALWNPTVQGADNDAEDLLEHAWSAWADTGASYHSHPAWGPLGSLMPRVDERRFGYQGESGFSAWRSKKRHELHDYITALQSGQSLAGRQGIYEPAHGPFHVVGHKRGAAAAGGGLYVFEPPVICPEEFRIASLRAAMATMRQDTSWISDEDGHAWTVPEILKAHGGRMPFKLTGTTSRQLSVVPYLKDADGHSYNNGTCEWLEDWQRVSHHDDQHDIRYAKNRVAQVWLAGDELAKEDLLAHFAWLRLSSPDPDQFKQAEKDENASHGRATSHRGHGWRWYVAGAAWMVMSTEQRLDAREWFKSTGTIIRESVLPTNGVRQKRYKHTNAEGVAQHWDHSPWDVAGPQGGLISSEHEATMAIHEAILLIGAEAFAGCRSHGATGLVDLRRHVAAMSTKLWRFMLSKQVTSSHGKVGPPNDFSVANHEVQVGRALNLSQIESWYNGPEVVNSQWRWVIEARNGIDEEMLEVLWGLLGGPQDQEPTVVRVLDLIWHAESGSTGVSTILRNMGEGVALLQALEQAPPPVDDPEPLPDPIPEPDPVARPEPTPQPDLRTIVLEPGERVVVLAVAQEIPKR